MRKYSKRVSLDKADVLPKTVLIGGAKLEVLSLSKGSAVTPDNSSI
jgi:hypothetical protein